MTEQNSTPTNPENQDTSIKTALNLRWKYFKSLHGDILAAQFDSDSLSANPVGVSSLPLFLIGFVLRHYRGLILRRHLHAQWLLGAAASAAAPVMSLLLILATGRTPLLGWFSLWQWFVLILIGAALTPVWFQILDRLSVALNYQRIEPSSFRPDREIKRGRF